MLGTLSLETHDSTNVVYNYETFALQLLEDEVSVQRKVKANEQELVHSVFQYTGPIPYTNEYTGARTLDNAFSIDIPR